LIRAFAFFKKDMVEVFRQPRLLFTLVLGPFLILLLFGMGFDPAPPTLRTVLVSQAGTAFQVDSEAAGSLGSQVSLVKTVTEESEARAMMEAGEADVAVIVPADAAATVQGGEQAVITILHDQIDPFEASVIQIFAQSAVDQINREVLQQLVEVGQEQAAEVEEPLPVARAAVSAMREAAAANDQAAYGESQEELVASLDRIAARLNPSASVVRGIDEQTGSGETDPVESLTRARGRADELSSSQPASAREETLAALEADLDELEQDLTTFRSIDAAVLVSPFRGAASNFQGITVDYTHYYIPGVVALLVQHLALTFAALSLVRERTLGTVELFRVSPLSGGEALVGKYLANLVVGALVGAALTAAAVFAFGFRPAGSWGWYVLGVVLVVLASQGLGFVLSALARTESQAVQYAMITLLVSIFFSGFFISLDRLLPSVRPLSFLIPATYGISVLQEVAFRGTAPNPLILAGAGVLALSLALIAWMLMRRRVMAAQPTRRDRALIAEQAAGG
jgi:ABC-2 type transport system permease protein